jgi:integrase
MMFDVPSNAFEPIATVAKRKISPRRTIPKPKRVRRAPASRIDVTRAEFNRMIDTLNERNVVLNALRDALHELQRASDVQFKRIAQIQAELDEVRRVWEKMKLPT